MPQNRANFDEFASECCLSGQNTPLSRLQRNRHVPQSAKKALFLVDGSAMAYRAYYAFIRATLSNGRGLNTGAIYGYTQSLKRIMETEKPDYMAVVFDTPKPTFRHELFPAYKANREKTPDDLREQLPWMKTVTKALSIPLIEKPGYEADDVICTLATQAAAQGFKVNIVTGDKDFMQIVSDDILLYDVMKPHTDLVMVDRAKVIEKFGVPPEQVVDVLALMGDNSDNVPGVSGVGPKTAVDLIKTFGSLEAALDGAESYSKKKIRENLVKEREQALLSKQLVTIDLDVPLELGPEDLGRQEIDLDVLDPLLKELAFEPLRKEFRKGRTTVEQDYVIVQDEMALDALVKRIKKEKFCVVDLETTGLDPLVAEIVGFAFSMAEGQAFYVPLNLDPQVVPDVLGMASGSGVVEILRPVLEDPQIGLCGQNIKYDLAVMRSAGIETKGIRFDTMIASYLLEPGSRDHNLDALSLRHFDHTKIKTSEIIGKGEDETTMDLIDPQVVGEYACEDADFTFRLYKLFDERMPPKIRKVFDDLEIPLIPVLEDMERHGIKLNADVLDELKTEIRQGLTELEASIYELSGEPELKINSPKQLSVVLFEKLKLQDELGIKPKKTKTGFSTNHEVLESMSGHPLPAKILEYRGLTKLLSTYVEALPKNISAKNWSDSHQL